MQGSGEKHLNALWDAQAWKPERAHHDSMAGRCVLRMDHYCAPPPYPGSLSCSTRLLCRSLQLSICTHHPRAVPQSSTVPGPTYSLERPFCCLHSKPRNVLSKRCI